MEQSSVLSLDSVDRIRFYVKHKYAHLPQDKHAEIVADAIVKIIERQLPAAYSTQIKRQITNSLIEKIVIPQKRPVSLQDIDFACSQAELADEDKALLEQWRIEKGIVTIPEPKLSSLWSIITTYLADHRKSFLYGAGCLLVIMLVIGYALAFPFTQSNDATQQSADVTTTTTMQSEVLAENELPALYQFNSVDENKLKEYLNSRGSLLIDEPYYSAIMDTSRAFNIHPVLLFAITGQEQGFVSREKSNAKEIANNPFNVFYSWEDYNTDIADSTAIAARTIVNLSKDRPADIDPIVWVNRKYAEDPNWSTGVKSLFTTIINYIND